MNSITAKYADVGKFVWESWAMGWPIILIMFFQFSIGIADVYVAGYLGTEIMAAVGYVGQLYWLLMILANGITVGSVSMMSQAYGAKSKQGGSNITAHSLVMGVAVSSVITILAQLYPTVIVRAAGMPAAIQEIAANFIRVFSLVLIPTYVMIISSGILRASGRVRIAMVTSFIASLATVIGDLTLGLGCWHVPSMGYLGIAWATAIGTTLGMVLNLYFLARGPDGIGLGCLRHPMPKCMKNLIKLGFPSALQQVAWNAGTLVVYFLVGQLRAGEITALAAMTAGVRIEAIVFLPIFALNMASACTTGNRLGAGDVPGARSGAKATAALCLAIILLPACTIFAAAPQVSGWLTSDQAVVAEMIRYLRINMIGMPFLALGVSLAGALQGAGDTLATMRIIFTGMWIFRIPFILVVVHMLHWGARGVWWAMTISVMVMCALFVTRFRGDTWTRASLDRETKTMLWEACLGNDPDAISTDSAGSRK